MSESSSEGEALRPRTVKQLFISEAGKRKVRDWSREVNDALLSLKPLTEDEKATIQALVDAQEAERQQLAQRQSLEAMRAIMKMRHAREERELEARFA